MERAIKINIDSVKKYIKENGLDIDSNVVEPLFKGINQLIIQRGLVTQDGYYLLEADISDIAKAGYGKRATNQQEEGIADTIRKLRNMAIIRKEPTGKSAVRIFSDLKWIYDHFNGTVTVTLEISSILKEDDEIVDFWRTLSL